MIKWLIMGRSINFVLFCFVLFCFVFAFVLVIFLFSHSVHSSFTETELFIEPLAIIWMFVLNDSTWRFSTLQITLFVNFILPLCLSVTQFLEKKTGRYQFDDVYLKGYRFFGRFSELNLLSLWWMQQYELTVQFPGSYFVRNFSIDFKFIYRKLYKWYFLKNNHRFCTL